MISRRDLRASIAQQLGLAESYNVAAAGRPPLWVAGLDVERAALVDIVAVPDPERWLLGPNTTVRQRPLVQAGEVALEARVQRYREVLDDPTNPLERLHLYTNADIAVDIISAPLVAAGLASRTVMGVVPNGR